MILYVLCWSLKRFLTPETLASCRVELGDIQKKVQDEKRQLRKTVKEFEESFR